MPKLDTILTQDGLGGLCIFKDTDALSVFARKTRFVHIPDRFGYLNQFSKWDYVAHKTPLPVSSFTGIFSDIMYKRANEIYDLAKKSGKKLYVMWSGGVDSTGMLLALLHVMEDIRYINVVYTLASIEEYPLFFNHLLSIKNLNLTELSMGDMGAFWEQKAFSDFVVTGFPADQLFGSIINQSGEILHGTDWRSWIKHDRAIGQFEEAFSFYGIPVKTIEQFTWFMNFACKWGLVTRALSSMWGLNDYNTIPFYETKDFQDWSMSNYDKLHSHDQKDPKYYKEELKKFCYSLFKDEGYLLNKKKIGSIGNAWRHERELSLLPFQPRVALLEEGGNLVQQVYYTKVPSNRRAHIQSSMLNRLLMKYRKTEVSV